MMAKYEVLVEDGEDAECPECDGTGCSDELRTNFDEPINHRRKSPDGDRAVVNEAPDGSSPSGLPSLLQRLRQAFTSHFMDGRNEHGTHLLSMGGSSVPSTCEEEIEATLHPLDGTAEEIFAAAEAMGHKVGHCICVVWHWVSDGDHCGGGYYEFSAIDPALTAAFHGTPEEQEALCERGQSPKGGAFCEGSVHADPVPEGNSPNESPENDAGEAT